MLTEFDVTTTDCFGVQTVTFKPEDLQAIAKKLHENFDVLIDVTAVDNISSLKLVYQFLDTKSKKRLSLVTEITEPRIASLTSLYQSANFLEREAFDMFGITFEGHPDLRRILLYDEFEGYPLRKSYPIDKKQPRIELRRPEERNDALDLTRPELRYREADFELTEFLKKKEAEPDRSNEILGGLKPTLKPHEIDDDLHSETVVVSFGPSHPATHGTIRIMTELLGEKIVDCDVEVGYLHRGFEKTAENRTYAQVLPYTDRLNYVSPLINNVGYCLTVEKLLGVEVPKRNQYIRVFMSEISRVSDHLTCLGASAMEIGAFTVMLYLMQAREYLWEIIEEITGARLTASYVRIGSLRYDLPEGIAEKVPSAFKKVRELVSMADRLLSRNRIFIDRMQGIGTISKEDALSFGLTGPILRATGVNYDVRKAFPYSSYEEFDFEVPLGSNGDDYDRFMVRMSEIEQSLRIAEQAISKMPKGAIAVDDPRIVLPEKEKVYGSIEGEIQHFNMIVKGLRPPKGEIYQAVEGGNGELGFFLVSDGSNIPYRLHVRAPSFIAMGAMKKLLLGSNVADIIPTFGMMNMIGGECDR